MKTVLTFYEHEGFEVTPQGISDEIAVSGLTAAELKSLEWFSNTHSPGDPVFSITQNTIRARQFVGMMCVGNKQIQILPKLLRAHSDLTRRDQMLKNLLAMLEFSHELDSIDAGSHRLSEQVGNFIEVYIHIFATRLLRVLRRSPHNEYVLHRNNLPFVKGKIIFPENVRHNIVDQSVVFCEYDDLTSDNIINQTFKQLAVMLSRLTAVSENKKLLTKAVSMMAEIETRIVSYEEIQSIEIPKRSKELRLVFDLAKMFMRHVRMDFTTGRLDSVAILIDMNKTFEEFIFEVFRRNADQLQIARVHFQKGTRLVDGFRTIGDETFQSRSMFDTFQDIVLDFATGRHLVIDTKYKLIGRDGQPHFGVSNSDVYQILAYRQLHIGKGETTVALLYPQYENNVKVEFQVRGNENLKFAVITVNLGIDLKGSLSNLVREMETVFVGLGLISNGYETLSNKIGPFPQ